MKLSFFSVSWSTELQLPRLNSVSGYRNQTDSINFGWAWDDNGDWFNEWEEYIFPCTPEEAREGTLRAVMNFSGETEAIEGNWFVKIPMRMIRFDRAEQ